MISTEAASALMREELSVSRETLRRMERYRDMALRWTTRINLFARSTLADFWTAHILDSAGLLVDFARSGAALSGKWCDMGAGGGAPVVPLAMIAQDRGEALEFHAIESDQRKAAFLREVVRALEVPISIHSVRIEMAPPLGASIVSARALASVESLLPLAQRHLCAGGVAVFPKGARADRELTEASRSWHINYKKQGHPLTMRGYILRLEQFAPSGATIQQRGGQGHG